MDAQTQTAVRVSLDALRTAQNLLDSVAFVSQPGDTTGPLARIARAIRRLEALESKPVIPG